MPPRVWLRYGPALRVVARALEAVDDRAGQLLGTPDDHTRAEQALAVVAEVHVHAVLAVLVAQLEHPALAAQLGAAGEAPLEALLGLLGGQEAHALLARL